MTLIPATAGFYPLHAFWGADFDRAQEIVAAINSLAMEGMGLGTAKVEILKPLSLREMLDAVDQVKAWNACPSQSGLGRSIYIVPAERLTAAVYTLLHYHLRPLGEDTDSIVRFTERRFGMDYVHLLVVAIRERSEVDAGDDECEEAA